MKDEWVEIHPQFFISRKRYEEYVFELKLNHKDIYNHIVKERETLRKVSQSGKPLIFQEKRKA